MSMSPSRERPIALVTGASRGIGAAIVWRLSDEASYVTGTFIDTAGGR